MTVTETQLRKMANEGDATIYAALQQYDRRLVTWQGMLEALVLTLAVEKSSYFKAAVRKRELSVQPLGTTTIHIP